MSSNPSWSSTLPVSLRLGLPYQKVLSDRLLKWGNDLTNLHSPTSSTAESVGWSLAGFLPLYPQGKVGKGVHTEADGLSLLQL